jgi:hypothetical protein
MNNLVAVSAGTFDILYIRTTISVTILQYGTIAGQ